MITIYAEKPDVARKIAAALGPIVLPDGTIVAYKDLDKYEKRIKGAFSKQGYIPITWNKQETNVTWGYGHLCQLKDVVDYDAELQHWKDIDLPFIPPKYQVKVVGKTSSQFNVVKKLFKEADLIINGTDWDREGELIFGYVYETTKCKTPFKRAYFASQNEKAFQEAFGKLVDSKDIKNMENAGRGRSIADWLVGVNLTVAASLSAGGYKGVISIGRVQTPTLAMVVDRELAIRDFVPKTSYAPKATFTTSKGDAYTGEYISKDKIEDKEKCLELLSTLTGNATVASVEKKTDTIGAPNLYSLGTLQMDANSKLGFAASKTLSVVQSLYEMGVVTYPRTDSAFLPEDYREQAKDALNNLAGQDAYKKYLVGKPIRMNAKYFNDSKIGSHFAIVPTHVAPKKMTPDQEKVYDLIARSLIMTIYPAAKVERTKVITEDNGVQFGTNGSVIVEKGWMEVGPASKESFLPKLKAKDKVKGAYELATKVTKPPQRYTDKTLVAAMISADKNADEKDIKSLSELDVKGIGTEATRAAIIENLIGRGYIERQKKSIQATEKGISVIQNLPVDDLKSATLTAIWENRLADIAEGKEDVDKFVADIEVATKKWCDEIAKKMTLSSDGIRTSTTSVQCPICGKNMVKHKWGYGCSGYKDGCDFSVSNTIAKKKLTDKQIETLIGTGNTPLIKGFTSKAGKKFNAKLRLNEKKVEFVFD